MARAQKPAVLLSERTATGESRLSTYLAGTWTRKDVLWWAGVAVTVPVVTAAAWWAAEKSYNSLTPYQVCSLLTATCWL